MTVFGDGILTEVTEVKQGRGLTLRRDQDTHTEGRRRLADEEAASGERGPAHAWAADPHPRAVGKRTPCPSCGSVVLSGPPRTSARPVLSLPQTTL